MVNKKSNVLILGFGIFFATAVTLFTVFLNRIYAQTVTQAKAFPEAEGFGAYTIGGRGGKVYEITNTNDSGSGSLRNCVADVNNYGARICIFKVGGLISLNSPLAITKPYITIAGQTAPGGGVTIKLGTATEAFSTQTHDVIIRYITVRPGPGGENHTNQIAKNGVELYNIIVDHNSLSWGVDSNIETWYRVKDATIQWSVISEGLNCSTHSKGCHSKGIMIGGYKGNESGTSPGSENISVLNNLIASNVDRNPLIQMCGVGQVINNVTYNAGVTFSHQQLNCKGTGYEGTSYVNWVNNYHKKGPAGSNTDLKIIPSDGGVCSSGKVYMSGNVGNNGAWSYSFSGSCDTVKANILTTVPATAPTVISTNANDTYNNTIAEGGAGNSRALNCDGIWYNRRDSIDTRVINNVINGTGSIINSPTDVGGWITPASGTACNDSDHDGMPDVWETAHGLNPNSATDGAQFATSGYTNLEMYLNGSGQTNGTPVPTVTPTSTPTPTSTIKPGDANGDDLVNEIDYTIWLSHYGQVVSGVTNGDFNGDGHVDGIDYTIWLNYYGK